MSKGGGGGPIAVPKGYRLATPQEAANNRTRDMRDQQGFNTMSLFMPLTQAEQAQLNAPAAPSAFTQSSEPPPFVPAQPPAMLAPLAAPEPPPATGVPTLDNPFPPEPPAAPIVGAQGQLAPTASAGKGFGKGPSGQQSSVSSVIPTSGFGNNVSRFGTGGFGTGFGGTGSIFGIPNAVNDSQTKNTQDDLLKQLITQGLMNQ